MSPRSLPSADPCRRASRLGHDGQATITKQAASTIPVKKTKLLAHYEPRGRVAMSLRWSCAWHLKTVRGMLCCDRYWPDAAPAGAPHAWVPTLGRSRLGCRRHGRRDAMAELGTNLGSAARGRLDSLGNSPIGAVDGPGQRGALLQGHSAGRGSGGPQHAAPALAQPMRSGAVAEMDWASMAPGAFLSLARSGALPSNPWAGIG